MLLCLIGLHRWRFVNGRLTGYLKDDRYVCARCGAEKPA